MRGGRRRWTSIPQFERELLLQHAAHGCISLWCATSERAYPFAMFSPRLVNAVSYPARS